ncbi:hypothetical protein BB558_000654 [Smittium angustum]|uniref:Uncharacterized protein n=1 Tax=Smittium angustum TaxID=133377 RepID=A0A2U1JDK3_SMIAN|nr:hypothetical protein BB558_000654 [Smittium angustum]
MGSFNLIKLFIAYSYYSIIVTNCNGDTDPQNFSIVNTNGNKRCEYQNYVRPYQINTIRGCKTRNKCCKGRKTGYYSNIYEDRRYNSYNHGNNNNPQYAQVYNRYQKVYYDNRYNKVYYDNRYQNGYINYNRGSRGINSNYNNKENYQPYKEPKVFYKTYEDTSYGNKNPYNRNSDWDVYIVTNKDAKLDSINYIHQQKNYQNVNYMDNHNGNKNSGSYGSNGSNNKETYTNKNFSSPVYNAYRNAYVSKSNSQSAAYNNGSGNNSENYNQKSTYTAINTKDNQKNVYVTKSYNHQSKTNTSTSTYSTTPSSTYSNSESDTTKSSTENNVYHKVYTTKITFD